LTTSQEPETTEPPDFNAAYRELAEQVEVRDVEGLRPAAETAVSRAKQEDAPLRETAAAMLAGRHALQTSDAAIALSYFRRAERAAEAGVMRDDDGAAIAQRMARMMIAHAMREIGAFVEAAAVYEALAEQPVLEGDLDMRPTCWWL